MDINDICSSELLKSNASDIQHFGVLGMHWGVRKGERAAAQGKLNADVKRKISEVYNYNGKSNMDLVYKVADAQKSINKKNHYDPENPKSHKSAVAAKNERNDFMDNMPKKISGRYKMGMNEYFQNESNYWKRIDGDMPPKKKSKISHSDIEEYITHYGVPGMKWGTRMNSDGSTSRFGMKTSATVNKYKSADKSSGKSISDLSNDDLKERLTRLNMEKNYKELIKPKKSLARKKIEKRVQGLIDANANKVLNDYVKQFKSASGSKNTNTKSGDKNTIEYTQPKQNKKGKK